MYRTMKGKKWAFGFLDGCYEKGIPFRKKVGGCVFYLYKYRNSIAEIFVLGYYYNLYQRLKKC